MVIPSVASANQLNILDEIGQFAPDQPLHIDIEDGNFIPNITFGMKTVSAIASVWAGPLDAHLLVTNPARYIHPLAGCGIKRVAFHIEATEYPLEIINQIRGAGVQAGLAFNLKTSLDSLYIFANIIDYVIVMTSEPDNEGQRFRFPACERIKTVRQILPAGKEVWADGGIDAQRLPDVYRAGADTVIMGRGIFGADNPRETFKEMNHLR
jgi:ribulose-phosphate 3-epimerase